VSLQSMALRGKGGGRWTGGNPERSAVMLDMSRIFEVSCFPTSFHCVFPLAEVATLSLLAMLVCFGRRGQTRNDNEGLESAICEGNVLKGPRRAFVSKLRARGHGGEPEQRRVSVLKAWIWC
jgi:hypothetical protein